MLSSPESKEPTREEIDALKCTVLIEFGAS